MAPAMTGKKKLPAMTAQKEHAAVLRPPASVQEAKRAKAAEKVKGAPEGNSARGLLAFVRGEDKEAAEALSGDEALYSWQDAGDKVDLSLLQARSSDRGECSRRRG